jgi:hypothetical protein
MTFQQRFESARDFVIKNARIIDRHLFDVLFCNGDGMAVATALKAYRNPDGGFGYGLEPDKRCPASLPVDIQVAYEYLDRAGVLEDINVLKELVLPACDFMQTITTAEGGLPFSLPVAKEYPHAPWWAVDEVPPASLNPTAAIVGLLTKHKVEHPWLKGATGYCWQAIAASESEMFHDEMPVLEFLQNAPDHDRAEKELDRIATRLQKPGVVELNTEAGGYVKMPLDWAPAPSRYFQTMFNAEVWRDHLEALAKRQQPDGGWPISWDTLSPGVTMEWRGLMTINALQTLRSYQKAGFSFSI